MLGFLAPVPTLRRGQRRPSSLCFPDRSQKFQRESIRCSQPTFGKARRHAASMVNVDEVVDSEDTAVSPGFMDPAFAKSVSGEWFGYECAFTVPHGKPMNIPERFVPDEFREWGVEIKGFDSLSSTNYTSDGTVLVKRTRALPSVGCEADAVVPEVSEQSFSTRDRDSINCGFPDGSFSFGPASVKKGVPQRWSIALVNPKENRSRVRVEFGPLFDRRGSVTVFIEDWDSPFRNGEVLPGCGGRHQSFATDNVLQTPEELAGKWEVETFMYNCMAGEEGIGRFSSVTERINSNVTDDLTIALPRGISVGITTDKSAAQTVVVGWLVESNLRVVNQRKHGPDGNLLSVSNSVETRHS